MPTGQLVLESEREVVEALHNNHHASALYKAKNYWCVVIVDSFSKFIKLFCMCLIGLIAEGQHCRFSNPYCSIIRIKMCIFNHHHNNNPSHNSPTQMRQPQSPNHLHITTTTTTIPTTIISHHHNNYIPHCTHPQPTPTTTSLSNLIPTTPTTIHNPNHPHTQHSSTERRHATTEVPLPTRSHPTFVRMSSPYRLQTFLPSFIPFRHR